MMRFRYARYRILLQVRDYWRNEADGDAQYIRKRSRCMGRLARPTCFTDIDTNLYVTIYFRYVFALILTIPVMHFTITAAKFLIKFGLYMTDFSRRSCSQ
jgi:hypothetical protein